MDQVERFAQAYSQAPWRRQMQFLGLFSAALVFAALIAGIYLSVTARAAEVGRDVQDMQRKIDTLEISNADLQARLAILTSASAMQTRALAIGFQPVTNEETMFISVPGYSERQAVVLAPGEVPALVSAPVLPDEYTESLFTWLQKEFRQSSFPFIVLR